MENRILPPPPPGISDADILCNSSKKRTFTAMSQHGIAGESHLEYGFTRESSQQHRTGSLSRKNVDGTSLGLFSAESATSRQKPEDFQFHGQNTFPEKVQNNDVNIHNSNVQPQSFQYRGYSSLVRPLGGETPWPSNCQPNAHNVWPTGENKTLYALNSCNASAGKADTDSSSQHHTSSSHGGMGNQSLEVYSSYSKGLKSSDAQEQNLINPGHSVDLDGKTDYPEAINHATSDFKQNDQDVNSLEEEASPRNRDDLKQAIAVAASPRNHDGSVNVDGENSQCSLQSNEKARPLSGKVDLAVAEKLWNGSLQLNSSVNITAAAFFKSGEKIPDTKWSESVEVKGKVRLEAFEKYIQDLPRSRNRGLMVISLRLKDSSSEAELTRMKQVANGYKEGKKVGFAQLSPGTDLYICPRSDAIITILAKHGFFKGKAAVQEDHDSFIGCVVWRRKRALPNSVTKKSEKKNCPSSKQPPSSPSASSVPGAPEITKPLAEPASKSTVASSTDYTASVNSVETLVIASEARLDGCSTSTMNSLPVSTAPCSSSLSVGLQASPCANSTSVQGPMGQSMIALAPLIHYSGQEKPKPSLVAPLMHYSGQEKPISSLEVKNHVLRPPSDLKKRHASINEDDDLPEYDFGFPSGNSQTRTSNEKLPAGGYGKKNGLMSTQQLQPTLNQRRAESVNVPRLPPDAIEKMSPLKRVSGGDQIPVVPVALIDATSAPRPKNLFDDDNDIPEWRPPEVKLHRQGLAERTKASTVSSSTPSIAPNLPVERLYPPRPPYPPPSPFYNNPPLPTQPRPRTAAPVSQPRPLPFERHVQKGPRPPVDLPVWRSWRP